MDGFRVWVRPMDNEYRVLVDGLENARWLVIELSRAFIFKSARPIDVEYDSSLCSFQVPLNSLLPFSAFQRMLGAIPRVTVVMQPCWLKTAARQAARAELGERVATPPGDAPAMRIDRPAAARLGTAELALSAAAPERISAVPAGLNMGPRLAFAR